MMTLTVDTVHTGARKDKATVGIVKFGPLVLASTRKPGHWSSEQLLKELHAASKQGYRGFKLTAQGHETLPVVLK